MALVLTIAGSTKSLREGSLRITESTNGRNTMQFQVVSVSGTYRPSLRDEVVLTEGGTRIFGGYIDSAREMGLLAADWGSISHACAAIDYNALADRKIVTETIPSGTLKAALQVLDDYLTDFSVSLDAGQVTGPTLPDLNFQNRTLASCLNEIAALTDYVWEIDYNKVFRMKSPAATAAAYSVTDANRKAIGDISVEPTQEDYANTVVVLGGEGQREVTETFTGNGVTTAFTLTYQHALNRGYVTNGGVFETLGTGATWDISTTGGVSTLTRTSAPANGNTIEITYTAQFPYVARADTGPAAADVVERIIAYPETFDATVLQSLATTLVARLSATRRVVKYSTLETSPHPGQTQTITIADRNLSTTCLITDVQVVDMGGNRLRRDVTAIEGTVYTGSWTDTIEGWSGGGSASSVSSVSGVFVLTPSGTYPGDVVANSGLTDSFSFQQEVGLRSSIGAPSNSATFGPGVTIGRADQDWSWGIVANELHVSGGSGRRQLVFLRRNPGSPDLGLLALSTDDSNTAGTYYLYPPVGSGATVDLGAAVGVVSDYNRFRTLYLSGNIFERNRTVAMGESTTYTPTWASGGGTPVTVGDATITGRYTKVGKMVFFSISFSFGSTSAEGAGNVFTWSLPSTAVSTAFGSFTARILDTGTAWHLGAGYLATTTAVAVLNQGNTGGGIGAGTPMTWASGDSVVIEGWYLEA